MPMSPERSDTETASPTPLPNRRVSRCFFSGFTCNKTDSTQFVVSPSRLMEPSSATRRGRETVPSSSGETAVTEKENATTDSFTSKTTASARASIKSTAESLLNDKLPFAYSEYLTSRNKRLKAILMNTLGTSFLKAGAEGGGVDMRFSVAASEAATRVIGLRRVPHKLLYFSCIAEPNNDWNWVDIGSHPTAAFIEYREALSQMLLDLGIHEMLVSDALETMLLPQAATIHGCHCIVVWHAVDIASTSVDNFQDLTNRFTILVADTAVITIHRMYCPFAESVKRDWPKLVMQDGETDKNYLLGLLVKESVRTFNTALAHSLVEFDRCEASLFSPGCHRLAVARGIYHIKRRASVYNRALNLIGDAYTHVCNTLLITLTGVQFQDVQQDIAHVRSLAEGLNSNMESVLQLHF